MRKIEKTNLSELAKTTNSTKKQRASSVPTASASGCTCGGSCPRCSNKLSTISISAPGSSLEREADQIAARATNGPTMQKKTAAQGPKLDTASASVRIGDNEVGLTGKPLSSEQRTYFEPGFGADLSHVRLHTGQDARALAEPLAAEAFTLGRNIVIGDPNFQASSVAGKNLLAHELAHTVQQGASPQLDNSRATGSSKPMIMRRLIRTAQINFLCGGSEPFIRSPNSGFMHLAAGETSISIHTNINWDRPESCSTGGTVSFILRRNRSNWFDADHGEQMLPVGTSGSNTWSGLEENADYYFEIRSSNTNPNCCLTGSFDVNTP